MQEHIVVLIIEKCLMLLMWHHGRQLKNVPAGVLAFPIPLERFISS